jgi:protease-4
VIASMGSVAASGGYFVAMAADKIVAEPATITGSIGVFGGKMVTTGFWNKLGVTWDEVHTSKNADVWTQTKDLTPAQWARMEAWLDRVYADFTAKVSQSRNIPFQMMDKIARGRIWSGEDGKRLGLVDALGGFPTALQLARKAARLPDDAPIRLKVYPEKKTLFKLISELKQVAADDENAAALAQVLEEVQPIVKTLESLRPSSRSDVLRMPEFE